MPRGTFCTAVTCMDGRVQMPVSEYLRRTFTVEYVDTITEPGPNAILAEGIDTTRIAAIFERISISVNRHKSTTIAVCGHCDCAGNPANALQQRDHILRAIDLVRKQFPDTNVIGLWVNESWNVEPV